MHFSHIIISIVGLQGYRRNNRCSTIILTEVMRVLKYDMRLSEPKGKEGQMQQSANLERKRLDLAFKQTIDLRHLKP